MSLPPISPTGVMSSGNYVDYMITYLNEAMDDEIEQLDDYLSDQVMDDWYAQWGRQITDLSADIVALNVRVNKLRAQTNMVRDAVNKL